MTEVAIQQQVHAIIKVTKEAGKSKETARKFLADAGILKFGKIIIITPIPIKNN